MDQHSIHSAITALSRMAYEDAKAHALYDDANLSLAIRSDAFVRRRLVLLIREEVCEAWEAAHDKKHFSEELADVVIMCMSAAGHLDIDLGAEIKRKMDINTRRPLGHKV